MNDLDRHRRAVHRLGSLGTYFRCASRSCKQKDKIWSSFNDFREHFKSLHDQEDALELIDQSRWLLPPALGREARRLAHSSQTCRDCGKQFKRPCDLTKHEKTHSRPWKCCEESCKYFELGWPTERERDRHVSDKHTVALSKYKCLYPPCTYESKRESNCKQHMEKAHGWQYVRSKGRQPPKRSISPDFSQFLSTEHPDFNNPTLDAQLLNDNFSQKADTRKGAHFAYNPRPSAQLPSSKKPNPRPSPPDKPHDHHSHGSASVPTRHESSPSTHMITKKDGVPKIAIKNTIAEDCSQEKQHRRSLLSCLREKPCSRPPGKICGKAIGMGAMSKPFAKGCFPRSSSIIQRSRTSPFDQGRKIIKSDKLPPSLSTHSMSRLSAII